MFWRRKELVDKDVLLETYRVRVYIKGREEPLEGIFKQEIIPLVDECCSYTDFHIHTPNFTEDTVYRLEGMKDNIKHYIPYREIRYIESEMIYRTPVTVKVLKENK